MISSKMKNQFLILVLARRENDSAVGAITIYIFTRCRLRTSKASTVSKVNSLRGGQQTDRSNFKRANKSNISAKLRCTTNKQQNKPQPKELPGASSTGCSIYLSLLPRLTHQKPVWEARPFGYELMMKYDAYTNMGHEKRTCGSPCPVL